MNPKFLNPQLKIGLVSFAVTAGIHLFLFITQNVSFDFMWAFYMMPMVFTVIGMGNIRRQKVKKEDSLKC